MGFLADFSITEGEFVMKGKRFSVGAELGLPVADAIRHVGGRQIRRPHDHERDRP